MRLSRYLASLPGANLSRRSADQLIVDGHVKVNGQTAELGLRLNNGDTVQVRGKAKEHIYTPKSDFTTILINKPFGYVCSRDGQGKSTVYDLIPRKYHDLKVAGRLDSDSTGLVIMSDDGDLIQILTHPSNNHSKIYQVRLGKPLTDEHRLMIINSGVNIGDRRLSKFEVRVTPDFYEINISEGRNRQIRRTFEKLGYHVTGLKRISMGKYELGNLASGKHSESMIKPYGSASVSNSAKLNYFT